MRKGRFVKTASLFALFILIISTTVSAGSWNAQTQKYTPSSGEVVFYDSEQCKGQPYMALKVGNYADFRSYNTGASGSPSWNDRASCIVVGPFTKVIVYEHINYKGKSKEYKASTAEKMFTLSGDRTWNNKISSCKVQNN